MHLNFRFSIERHLNRYLTCCNGEVSSFLRSFVSVSLEFPFVNASWGLLARSLRPLVRSFVRSFASASDSKDAWDATKVAMAMAGPRDGSSARDGGSGDGGVEGGTHVCSPSADGDD